MLKSVYLLSLIFLNVVSSFSMNTASGEYINLTSADFKPQRTTFCGKSLTDIRLLGFLEQLEFRYKGFSSKRFHSLIFRTPSREYEEILQKAVQAIKQTGKLSQALGKQIACDLLLTTTLLAVVKTEQLTSIIAQLVNYTFEIKQEDTMRFFSDCMTSKSFRDNFLAHCSIDTIMYILTHACYWRSLDLSNLCRQLTQLIKHSIRKPTVEQIHQILFNLIAHKKKYCQQDVVLFQSLLKYSGGKTLVNEKNKTLLESVEEVLLKTADENRVFLFTIINKLEWFDTLTLKRTNLNGIAFSLQAYSIIAAAFQVVDLQTFIIPDVTEETLLSLCPKELTLDTFRQVVLFKYILCTINTFTLVDKYLLELAHYPAVLQALFATLDDASLDRLLLKIQNIAISSGNSESILTLLKDLAHYKVIFKESSDNTQKRTLLHRLTACYNDQDDIFIVPLGQLMVENGVDINALDREGHTCLDYALMSSNAAFEQKRKDNQDIDHPIYEIVRYLISKGAHFSCGHKRNNIFAICYAELLYNPELLTYVLQHGQVSFERLKLFLRVLRAVHSRNNLQELPLMHTIETYMQHNNLEYNHDEKFRFAAHMGNIAALERLLCDVDINSVDDNGNTALMLACQVGRTDVVLWLLEHGADINLYNKLNQTASTMAAQVGQYQIVAHLQEVG